MGYPESAPSIPRERWSSHPHYPAQLLLLGSHENFRRLSSHLIAGVSDGQDTSPIRALYSGWIGAMRSHEAYEEHKLYPYLARRWNVSFEAALRGHHELHERDAAVRDAFASAPERAVDPSRAKLLGALKAHDATLNAHLRLEEDLVIPLLLELRPEEFDAYYNLPIDVLMGRFEK